VFCYTFSHLDKLSIVGPFSSEEDAKEDAMRARVYHAVTIRPLYAPQVKAKPAITGAMFLAGMVKPKRKSRKKPVSADKAE
jgi:hypothetical protein